MTGPRFPTPWTIEHQAYSGLLLDDLNNEVPAWDDPADVRVIGWRLTVSEQLGDYTSRQVVEGVLTAPPELVVNVRDRFTLPAAPGRPWTGGVFEVTEATDANHGPHQWNPGYAYKIRKTPETRQQVLSHGG